jgi:hypothetical protein
MPASPPGIAHAVGANLPVQGSGHRQLSRSMKPGPKTAIYQGTHCNSRNFGGR